MRALHAAVLFSAAALAMAAINPPLTADQVVAHSLAARGGAARFAAIHSFHYTGHLDFGGSQGADLNVWGADRPHRIRIEVKLAQGTQVQAYDGKTAWQILPGQSKPEIVTGPAAANIINQAENFVDLIADPGTRPTLAGTGTLDGHPYIKVRFTIPATGDAFTQYFDTTTWLAFHEEYPSGVEDISGYHPVDGIQLPSRYVSGPPGRPGIPLVWQSQTLSPTPASPAQFTIPQ